ncbi:MAG: GNAT family N-acetyltransferase [Clostridia bacterium]|jgi:ribosomal protein S18 acetylase RimI-like enzyme
MIITSPDPYIGQLQLIDIKSHEWPWYEEGWRTIREYNWRLWVESDVVIGFSCFKVIRGQAISELQLAKLCVRPRYREHGIGARLMDDLVSVCNKNGITMISTIVHEECKYLGWMKKHGFQAVNLIKELFPDTRDGIVMRRML